MTVGKNSASVLLAVCLLAQTGCTADTITCAGVALLALSCAGLGALVQGRGMWRLDRRLWRLESRARRPLLGVLLLLLAAGAAHADDPVPDAAPASRFPPPPSEPGPAGGPQVHRSPQPPPSPCCAWMWSRVDRRVDLPASRPWAWRPLLCGPSPWPRVCGVLLPLALALGALGVLLVLALVAAAWRRNR